MIAGAKPSDSSLRLSASPEGLILTLFGRFLLTGSSSISPHHHPAEEYYFPLGAIRWDHGEGWVDEPAGELIHHEPWQPHAMRTDARPVLLAYLWFGEVTTPSAFVTADPAP